MNIEKLPPHDLDAEEAVIGSLLIDGDAIRLVEHTIKSGDFYHEINRWLFQACLDLRLRREAINQITVAQELSRQEKLEPSGGAAYLSHLIAVCPTSLDIENYAQIVRRLSVSRQLIGLGGQIATVGYNAEPDANEAMDKAVTMVADLRKSVTVFDELVHPKDAGNVILDMISEYNDPKHTISWGFSDLDYLTSGIYPELIIFGSRPSVGKCLAEDTLVYEAESGKMIKVKDFKLGMKCLSLDGHKVSITCPTQIYDNGFRECYKVITSSGREIETTSNHPFLTGRGWVELGSISVGEKIATPRVIPKKSGYVIGEASCKLLGYLLGDGGMTQDVRFSNADDVIICDFRESLSKAFPSCELLYHQGYDYRIVKKTRGRKKPNPVKEWLEDIGCYGKLSKDKVIPDIVYQISANELALVLKALFSCDGSVERHGISIVLASKYMIYQIQHLLLRFGILSQVHYKKTRCNGRKFNSWRLAITDTKSFMAYWECIGFIGKKACYSPRMKKANCTNIDSLPMEFWDLVKNKCQIHNTSLFNIERIRVGKPRARGGINPHYKRRGLTRARLSEYANILNDCELKEISESDIFWDSIKEIIPVGMKHTYDLTIPSCHNFIANDIFVHNTQIMLDVLENLAWGGKKILFCSAEMLIKALMERKIARDLKIDIRSLRKSGLPPDLMDKLVQLSGEVSERQVYYMPQGISSHDIYSEATKMKETIGLDIVFVDYLQILKDCWQMGKESKVVLVGRAAKVLKSLSNDLQIPVICASQLSRDIEHRPQDSRKPVLADLRESGDIEQDADVVFLLWRDLNNEDENIRSVLEVKMAKNRQLGDAPFIRLNWKADEHRYVDAYRGE